MKNVMACVTAIGAVLLLANPAAADWQGHNGRHQGQHWQHQGQRFGQRQPWGHPGYYHPRRQNFYRQGQQGGYYGQNYQNGYYAQPPIVYAPPPPPPGLSFFLGLP